MNRDFYFRGRGFEGSFTIEELKREWRQAEPVMGLDEKTIGSCGWVNYNAPGLDGGRRLHDFKIMLAFEENGKKIEPAGLDAETGRITGTGLMRLIVPQFQPSPPDLPKYADPACREKIPERFHFTQDYDHNGGRSSFLIIAVRIHPLPEGTRDFEWEKIRGSLARDEKIVFFGAIQSGETE
ncbi:MAG: hypothetical protein JW793_08360 [Acidobacteria bacterium]|nr:hypothetical protein [Acidobacteriota bacterium]